MKNGKIQSFTDLKVWQEGHILVIMVYKITKKFPREELYSFDSSDFTGIYQKHKNIRKS